MIVTTRRAVAVFVLASLAACAVPPPPPVAPPPPPPAPTPTTTAVGDWRDAPQTPGDWSYAATASGSAASFSSGGSTVFALICDPVQRRITVSRAGQATAALPMTLRTTSTDRTFNATPAPGTLPTLAAVFSANDPLLDALAYSRGRFAVEVNGLPTLYLPAWSEVGRVTEDCRR